MKLKFNGTKEQLNARIKSVGRNSSFPSAEIVSGSLRDNKIQLSGLFSKSRGVITKSETGFEISMKTQLKNAIYLLGILVLLMLLCVILLDNVSIDDKPNPSVWIRLGYAGLVLTMLLPFVLVLVKLNKKFENKVKVLFEENIL